MSASMPPAAQTPPDEVTRAKIITDAYKVIAELEAPSEFLSRVLWAEPSRVAAMQLALDLGLFSKLAECTSPDGLSAAQLTDQTGADPVLAGRTLKHLAAMFIIRETSQAKYVSTRMSRALVEARYGDGVESMRRIISPTFLKIPEFLAARGYINPIGTGIPDGKTPFMFALNTEYSAYQWLREVEPQTGRQFMNYMGGKSQGIPFWCDDGFYPVQQRLQSSDLEEKDAVLMVDVGGGLGHDLNVFAKKYADSIPGRLILQDEKHVIASIDKNNLHPKIELEIHDFFKKQPIIGARVYFLHHIFHNWDDEKCKMILTQLRNAMRKGYSKILAFEMLVPSANENGAWKVTGMDWAMMGALGAMERSKAQWEALFDAAGLKMENFWTNDSGSESIIEVVTK